MPDRTVSRLEAALFTALVAAILFMQVNQGQVFAAVSTRSEPVSAPAMILPVEWPTSIGATESTYTVAVAVLRSTVVTGRRTATVHTTVDEERRMLATLEEAESAIRRWSNGTISVRFVIVVVDTPVRISRARGDEWWRWPHQAGITIALADRVKDADMILTLWSDRHTVGGANLAGTTDLPGRLLPYLSIPVTEWSSSSQSAEALVHEFCHGLETLARSAGTERPELHDAGRYGFTADEDGSWSAWYTFFLTHSTRESADAAGRLPLASTPADFGH